MLAFADTRTIAVFVVKAQGYDPALAGHASRDALPEYGAERLRRSSRHGGSRRQKPPVVFTRFDHDKPEQRASAGP